MKADARREEIADYITRAGQARIEDLVEHFGVSRMTIHRHIDALAQQGVLRKLHGMVTVQPSGLYESTFRYRETVGKAEKEALARAAMAYVEAGQAVMLDDSSTACALADLLPEARPLTVITNSYISAGKLIEAEEVELISLGGKYHRNYNAYIGITCEKAVASLRATVLFCSASAIDGVTAFIQDAQVTKVKQAMMASSSRKILLVDSSKFGKVALNVLSDLTAFDVVLTTDRVGEADRARLKEAGVNLEIVKMGKST
ncbi:MULTISPECIES: DeoR/GlpR family DNA-binding transcription regulator [unclassified Shinella]|uniref:DeoR/GlpR family DNA-binding transcription regulator n=1 Tax=unclassified Shinella TaxID=2643062 RepID=UPI00225D534D|nr:MULTISPECIES: DeoR/GlpR family DNA-binding transcription regulator [unclassified Shinella]MCO5137890.1 DeoR/GlpR family DNA-binding transcription regulator [Shinella sp.]MDC7258007.1 DeoR/GlpR family DNA-binding transcription regulator [Shinella sp. YE25]CAI0335242.1 DeoR/GlpR transcriptional regulator [Rhizobiaceae bacterium]CAK7259551.1 DeoR/GlpR transcriptional regulator [Shinella sp. WSC3-e]